MANTSEMMRVQERRADREDRSLEKTQKEKTTPTASCSAFRALITE